MAESNNEIRDKLKLLQERYLMQLPDKLNDIDICHGKLLKNPGDKETIRNLYRLAHSIKGSSATFGFADVSTAAKALAKLVEPFDTSDTQMEAETLLDLRSFTAMLREAVEGLKQKNNENGLSGSSKADIEETIKPQESKFICMYLSNSVLLEELSSAIRQFGYEVAGFALCDTFENAVQMRRPSVLILEVDPLQKDDPCFAKLMNIRKELGSGVPAIFISDRDDVNARLQAVRLGSDAYFSKPVNIQDLTDKLDSLTTSRVAEPYKILVVDDEQELADYHSLMLEEAGMVTEIVNSPLRVFDRLSEFGPDLILMDMYMPQCDGMELARTIRQMKAYFSIPIVFLSGETNVDKQLSAMIMGGDEFLTKPIKPQHLISSVVIRAERMRTIRSFMERDSLTGLLNHTKTKIGLDIAVARSRRLTAKVKAQTSFAMIDIDKFKLVNDTYGHPVGDRVIASLGRLLQQSFRKTDIIGRYGGEEFAVVLAETDVHSAQEMLDKIRIRFSQIKFRHEDREFSVTFSVGVAAYPEFGNTELLSDAADRALYEAKRTGRNKVCIASVS